MIEGRKFDVMIPNGTKISLEAGKITFKDSMAFLPMALSAFTDTFGLTELKKGFFLHKFHTVRYLKFLTMIRRECRVRKKKNSKCGIEKKQPNNTHLISKKNCLHTVTQMLRYWKLDVKNSSKNFKASPVSILWKNALRSPQRVTVIGGGNIYP